MKGLEQETRRLGFRPAAWTSLQDARDVEVVREVELSFSYFANAGSEVEESRKGDVEVILEAVREGLLSTGQAQKMLNALAEQWRREATDPDSLLAQVQAAQRENARLKGR